MIQNKAMKEKIIENYLRYYRTYQTSIKNCEQQLEYIMPTLVSRYGVNDLGTYFYIANNTSAVALDRIESKRALDLKEQIEQNKLIVSSIENAMKDLQQQEKSFVQLRYFEGLSIEEIKDKLGYKEEKSVFRIRRHCLDKLLISLSNLLSLK